jgi:hypothetical protein
MGFHELASAFTYIAICSIPTQVGQLLPLVSKLE